MEGHAILVRGAWKTYPGGVVALRGLSLRVSYGEVVGLAGPNGAGKTTTLRLIAGLLRPDSGEVRVAGLDPYRDSLSVRRILGYLPEDAGVYKHMTGLEFLEFYASLYASSGEEASRMVREAVKLSGLDPGVLRRPAGSYSKGMKRRLLVAKTLMTNPRVIVMDEPTSGVDVEHAVAIRRILRERAREGAAILISSHNLMEMEVVADRVYIIDGGRIVAEGPPRALMEEYGVETLEEVYLKAVGGRVAG